VINYTAIHVFDTYMSYLPGSNEERKRLERERKREENKMLGWLDGWWVWLHPQSTEEGKKD
jgi:hypothetical protein